MTRSDRGFTIVEVLGVAGVMAILLSLLLPALSNAKEAARQAKCLTQIRNHQQLVFAYAIEYDDQVPYVWAEVRRAPDEIRYPPPPGGGDWYLAVTNMWQVPLMDNFGGNGMHETLFCPSNPARYYDADDYAAMGLDLDEIDLKQLQGTRDYGISAAQFLDPAALDPDGPGMDPEFYVPRRLSETAFPSDKAFFIDGGPPYHDPQWRRDGVHASPFNSNRIVAFSDGSAVMLNTAEVTPGLLMNPTGDADRDRLQREMNKLDLTPWGVRGRDR